MDPGCKWPASGSSLIIWNVVMFLADVTPNVLVTPSSFPSSASKRAHIPDLGPGPFLSPLRPSGRLSHPPTLLHPSPRSRVVKWGTWGLRSLEDLIHILSPAACSLLLSVLNSCKLRWSSQHPCVVASDHFTDGKTVAHKDSDWPKVSQLESGHMGM